MKILAIDTSCDETAAAVTNEATVVANIVWSQASAHAKFGGVLPSLAQRMHEERIDWVIDKAFRMGHQALSPDIEAVAVTVGPGLAIALGVGIDRAKRLAEKYRLPLIPINHVEAHLLSPLAQSDSKHSPPNDLQFPALGLCISGGNTVLVIIKKIGQYQILAQTQDDALGEALDKAARMLGLGYPGGAILEEFARRGNPKTYALPLPMAGQENKGFFSYSGLKTAFFRLIEKEKPLTKEKIQDLAASFQSRAFDHLIRVTRSCLNNNHLTSSYLLVGGGVAANIEIRKRLRQLGQSLGLKVLFPYSQKLTGDNAAMVGVAAYLKIINQKLNINAFFNLSEVDRHPNLKL